MVEKKEKNRLNLPTNKTELSKAEKEILHLITDEFLTIKQIKLQRDCSLQAIYKHLKNLKKKGYLGSGLNKVEKIQSTIQPNQIRLHAQEFNIKILFQDSNYQKQLKKSNMFYLDSNTIRLYKNSIEIYSGNSFIGNTTKEAESKSLEYWLKFFLRLESELKITIIKQRTRNIKEVSHHFASLDSEICKNAINHKKMIRVFAEEDGKLCYVTDGSFGGNEDETLHPETAKKDREAIDKQINDIRLNNPPTITETYQVSSKTALQLNILTQTMSDYAKHIKSHTEAIKSLSKAMPQLITTLKQLKGENERLKQRRLSDY
jgi:DNA-binding CsgD family transcriptional regulator